MKFMVILGLQALTGILIVLVPASCTETETCPMKQMYSCSLLKIKTYRPFKDWYLFVKNHFLYDTAQFQYIDKLEGWKASCDIFKSYQRCLQPLIVKCYHLFWTNDILRDARVFEFICNQLSSHPGDLACLYRRLKMSETFPCYTLKQYNDIRGECFIKNHTEAAFISCYSTKLGMDCISKYIEPYCSDKALSIFKDVTSLLHPYCNLHNTKYPSTRKNSSNWSYFAYFTNSFLMEKELDKHSMGETFKTTFKIMAKSWDCFTFEQWANMPTEHDEGWFKGFPITRGYLIKNVLREDWFNSICHSLRAQIQPCMNKVQAKYKHYINRNFIDEGLNYLCTMSFKDLKNKVYKVLLCTEEQDELSNCTAPIFTPSVVQTLVSDGHGVEELVDRHKMMNQFCWVSRNVSGCIKNQYKVMRRRCGDDIIDTLIALRKILLLDPRNYLQSFYYSFIYDPVLRFWPFKRKPEDLLKFILVSDPFTGDTMSFCN